MISGWENGRVESRCGDEKGARKEGVDVVRSLFQKGEKVGKRGSRGR